MDIHTHNIKYSGNDISARPNSSAQGTGNEFRDPFLYLPFLFQSKCDMLTFINACCLYCWTPNILRFYIIVVASLPPHWCWTQGSQCTSLFLWYICNILRTLYGKFHESWITLKQKHYNWGCVSLYRYRVPQRKGRPFKKENVKLCQKQNGSMKFWINWTYRFTDIRGL